MPRRRKRKAGSSGQPARVDELLYPTLDLHGETAESARQRAERWLSSERAAGASTVRIITGRGLHSAGPPVLPGEIESLLGSLKGSVVSRWTKEPGGGVYRIDLRRGGETRRAATPGKAAAPLPEAPAELRRAAEEALLDLGITPTPELIAAEIRRMRGGEG